MDNILTDEHKKLINKKVKEAINKVDFEQLVTECIEREFESLYEEGEVGRDIQSMVNEVIKQHLVKSGLLKDVE